MSAARREHGRNALWAMLGQGAGQTLQLLMFLVIARFVTKESFGIVAVSLAVIEFLRRLLVDPVAIGVYARPDAKDRDYDTCFTIVLTMGLSLAVALFLFAHPIAELLGTPSTGSALQFLSLMLVGYGLSATPGAWLARRMQFRALAVRSTVSVLAGGTVGISMAIAGFDLWSLVGQQLTISVVNVITLWLGSDWRARFDFERARVREIARRGRPISYSAFWNSIANDADLFFAMIFFGPAVTGVYNAGKRIMQAANLLLVGTVSTLTMPTLANMDKVEDRREAFRNGVMLTSTISAPAFAGLAAIAPALVFTLLGESWLGAAPVLMALAASGYVLSLAQFSTSVLVVGARAHIDSLCAAAAAIINLIGFLLMVRFGPVALAATCSFTTLAIFPVRMHFALKALDMRFRDMLVALLPSLGASALMLIALFWLRGALPASLSPFVVLGILLPSGVILYGAALRVCSPALFSMVMQIAVAIAGRDMPQPRRRPRAEIR